MLQLSAEPDPNPQVEARLTNVSLPTAIRNHHFHHPLRYRPVALNLLVIRVIMHLRELNTSNLPLLTAAKMTRVIYSTMRNPDTKDNVHQAPALDEACKLSSQNVLTLGSTSRHVLPTLWH